MLERFFELVSELIRDHWLKVLALAAVGLGGWWLGKWRAKTQWRKKEFLNRLNISLNVLRDGKLLIRTLLEKSLEDVFLNAVAVRMVRNAAEQTTEKDPILPLAKDDAWYLLNSILNEIAEEFSEGQVKRDLGLPVTIGRYLICLTRERAGAMRTHKIRAMVIQKKQLLELPEEMPELESPNHGTRYETLRSMAAAYRKRPEQFLDVEICI